MLFDEAWEAVAEFHVAGLHPVSRRPKSLPKDRVAIRSDWMKEEIEEFVEAESLEDQVDAMIDLMYFALGTLVEMGVRPARMFEIVHAANMKKFSDGDVKLRPGDGKVQKPSDWADPKELIRIALGEEIGDWAK